jgi:hypothetical protein
MEMPLVEQALVIRILRQVRSHQQMEIERLTKLADYNRKTDLHLNALRDQQDHLTRAIRILWGEYASASHQYSYMFDESGVKVQRRA